MHDTLRAGAAALALVCSITLAATGAVAQTSGPTAQPGQTAQPSGQPSPSASAFNPNADQTQALFKSLEDMVVQSIPGFQPSAGTKVPQDVKTQPMPPQGAAALPEAKDHHVAKTDDDQILIVDPVTREVVGIISAGDDDGSSPGTNGSKPGSGSSN